MSGVKSYGLTVYYMTVPGHTYCRYSYDQLLQSGRPRKCESSMPFTRVRMLDKPGCGLGENHMLVNMVPACHVRWQPLGSLYVD
jgi:hypothetical protein